jgi:hypothetical protein
LMQLLLSPQHLIKYILGDFGRHLYTLIKPH